MTERKTTEIKIRVTPSFKARVQGAADAAGVSLTEWLETSAQERIWADENRSFDGHAIRENILAAYNRNPDASEIDPVLEPAWKYKGG